jgi:hypothetical protein
MIERSATRMTPTRGVPVISRHRTVDSGSRPGTAFPGNLYLEADELPDIGDPQADPLAGRRRKELDQRRQSAPSHVYERTGPVRFRPVYRGRN